MAPRGSVQLHTAPQSTWLHKAPHGSTRLRSPRGSIRFHTAPQGSTRLHTAPQSTCSTWLRTSHTVSPDFTWLHLASHSSTRFHARLHSPHPSTRLNTSPHVSARANGRTAAPRRRSCRRITYLGGGPSAGMAPGRLVIDEWTVINEKRCSITVTEPMIVHGGRLHRRRFNYTSRRETDPGYMSRKIDSLERIKPIRETN